jgi:type II secretory pathway component PulF
MKGERIVRVQPGSLSAKMAFGWKVRHQFYAGVVAQNSNGVPLPKCVELYAQRAKRKQNWALYSIAKSMLTMMSNGADFADAVAPWVPQDEASQVAAGVIGQNLPHALEKLIEAKEISKEIITHVKSAMTTPVLNVLIGLSFFIFMGMTIVPQFEGIVSKSSASGSVYALYVVSEFSVSWVFWALLVFAALAIGALLYSLPRWTGQRRVVMDGYFPFSLYKEFQGYLWMTSFVAIISAKVPEVQALNIQAERATPWMAERLKVIREDMESGGSLPQALVRQRHAGRGFEFPSSEIVEMVEQIHGFRDFAERMAGVQRHWIKDLAARVKQAGNMVGMIGTVLTYGVIIFITIASVNLQNELQDHVGSVSSHIQTR